MFNGAPQYFLVFLLRDSDFLTLVDSHFLHYPEGLQIWRSAGRNILWHVGYALLQPTILSGVAISCHVLTSLRKYIAT
jgi:hypothetical protein